MNIFKNQLTGELDRNTGESRKEVGLRPGGTVRYGGLTSGEEEDGSMVLAILRLEAVKPPLAATLWARLLLEASFCTECAEDSDKQSFLAPSSFNLAVVFCPTGIVGWHFLLLIGGEGKKALSFITEKFSSTLTMTA